jgi:hypothetical protein
MSAREAAGPLELNVDPDYVRVVVARSRAALFTVPDAEEDDVLMEVEIDSATALEREPTDRLSEELAPDASAEEAAAMIDVLNVDEQAELVALTFIGRGDFEAAELEAAVREAKSQATGPASRFLFAMEQFPDHLENGLDAWEAWRAGQPDADDTAAD